MLSIPASANFTRSQPQSGLAKRSNASAQTTATAPLVFGKTHPPVPLLEAGTYNFDYSLEEPLRNLTNGASLTVGSPFGGIRITRLDDVLVMSPRLRTGKITVNSKPLKHLPTAKSNNLNLNGEEAVYVQGKVYVIPNYREIEDFFKPPEGPLHKSVFKAFWNLIRAL